MHVIFDSEALFYEAEYNVIAFYVRTRQYNILGDLGGYYFQGTTDL